MPQLPCTPLSRALLLTCLALVAGAGCMRNPAKLVLKDPPTEVFSKKSQEHKLRAVVYDKDEIIMEPVEPVKWESSAPTVLAVDDKGVLTALSSGIATIRATVKAEPAPLSAELSVRAAIVGSVEIEPGADQTLKFDKTLQLKAVVKNDKGEVMPDAKVRWSTSSHAVDISPEGLATGQALGSTQVFATVGDKVGAVRINVKD